MESDFEEIKRQFSSGDMLKHSVLTVFPASTYMLHNLPQSTAFDD